MSIVTSEVTGDRETLRAIEKFARDVNASGARGVMRKAVRAAMTPIRQDLRRVVPKDTGLLRRSITSKLISKAQIGKFTGVVGARDRRDEKTRRNPARYLHLVDRGAKPHKIRGPVAFIRADGVRIVRPSVDHPGARAQRVLERAFSASKSRATEAFKSKARTELEAAAKRNAARQQARRSRG